MPQRYPVTITTLSRRDEDRQPHVSLSVVGPLGGSRAYESLSIDETRELVRKLNEQLAHYDKDRVRQPEVRAWADYGIAIIRFSSNEYAWSETGNSGRPSGPWNSGFATYADCLADLKRVFGDTAPTTPTF